LSVEVVHVICSDGACMVSVWVALNWKLNRTIAMAHGHCMHNMHYI
jgi:hypothetical protein